MTTRIALVLPNEPREGDSDADEQPHRHHRTPSLHDDADRWQRHVDEEMRPLADSLARLRDRGLLD